MRAFGILFFQFGNAGWSEVYPMNVADYPTALANLNTLAGNRLGLLVNDVNLIGLRISDSDVKGDSYPISYGVPAPGTFATTPADQTYNDQLAIRIEFIAALTQRCQRWLRCLPKSQVTAAGNFSPTMPFQTALTAYEGQVENLCAAAHKIPGAIAPPYYTFTNYSGYAQHNSLLSRKLGRPFGLRPGRRLIA